MEWWQDMFASPAWQALQLAWEDADDGDVDADQVWRALALAPGARVLDVPCGTGRLARRLRARGCRVVGIDATPAFLVEAAAAGVPVVRADMRTRVVARGGFDAALCWWGSFGYFDEEDNRAQVDAAAASLVPGGRYLIDTFVADSILPRFVAEAEWAVADIHVRESRRYDERERRIATTWTFAREGETTRQTSTVRVYTLVELMELLSEVGFVSFQALDEELRPFQATADRLRLVATMPD